MTDHHASTKRAIENTYKTVWSSDRIVTHFVSSHDHTGTPFGMEFVPEHDKQNRIRRISIHVGHEALAQNTPQAQVAYNFARYAFSEFWLFD